MGFLLGFLHRFIFKLDYFRRGLLCFDLCTSHSLWTLQEVIEEISTGFAALSAILAPSGTKIMNWYQVVCGNGLFSAGFLVAGQLSQAFAFMAAILARQIVAARFRHQLLLELVEKRRVFLLEVLRRLGRRRIRVCGDEIWNLGGLFRFEHILAAEERREVLQRAVRRFGANIVDVLLAHDRLFGDVQRLLQRSDGYLQDRRGLRWYWYQVWNGPRWLLRFYGVLDYVVHLALVTGHLPIPG